MIVVVVHDSLISTVLSRSLNSSFSRKDKIEIVIQCPYFTGTPTAYTFGVIIVLSCEKLHSSARDFLRLEHLFKANVSTSIPVLYIKTKSTETTVIVTISFLPFGTGFLPSQQRVISLTRKYVASHLFCCHGVISA